MSKALTWIERAAADLNRAYGHLLAERATLEPGQRRVATEAAMANIRHTVDSVARIAEYPAR